MATKSKSTGVKKKADKPKALTVKKNAKKGKKSSAVVSLGKLGRVE